MYIRSAILYLVLFVTTVVISVKLLDIKADFLTKIGLLILFIGIIPVISSIIRDKVMEKIATKYALSFETSRFFKLIIGVSSSNLEIRRITGYINSHRVEVADRIFSPYIAPNLLFRFFSPRLMSNPLVPKGTIVIIDGEEKKLFGIGNLASSDKIESVLKELKNSKDITK